MEDLLQAPPYSVALHRGTDLFRDRKAQSWSTYSVWQNVNREQSSPVDRPFAVDPLKLGRTSKACAPAPVQRLNGQPFTSSTPARSNNPAASGRAHTLTETVSFGPLAAVRLVSALHKILFW